jgi:hypothetical protein
MWPGPNLPSTAETVAFSDESHAVAATSLAQSLHKFEFSFLNGNLMVPVGHQFIFG